MKSKTAFISMSLLLISICCQLKGATMQAKNKITATPSENLFNGRDLSGWKHVGSGSFTVENHLLTTQHGMGLLFYEKKMFGNARLHVVFKTTYPESNSGIFVRIGDKPKTEWDAVHNGYEIQICDAGSDAFDDYHRTGAIYSFSKTRAHAFKAHDWNTFDILLQQEKIIVLLNGVKVNEFDPTQTVPHRQFDFEPKRGPRSIYGYIGVQNHDHNAIAPDSHVYFKEISVHPLDGQEG